MPANQGKSPNWHPTSDITGRHSIKPAVAERFKPKNEEDFVKYLGNAGLPEFDCYFGDAKNALIKEEVSRVFKQGAFSDDMIAEIYGEAPQPNPSPLTHMRETMLSMVEFPVDESEIVEPITMLVATITYPDGSISSSAAPAPIRRSA